MMDTLIIVLIHYVIQKTFITEIIKLNKKKMIDRKVEHEHLFFRGNLKVHHKCQYFFVIFIVINVKI